MKSLKSNNKERRKNMTNITIKPFGGGGNSTNPGFNG